MAELTITYGNGLSGETYTPNKYSELGNMIGKVARQVMTTVKAYNPLGIFEKTPIDKGDTIEEVVTKLAKAYAFPTKNTTDEDDFKDNYTDVFNKVSPELAVRYYKNWTASQYHTTVDRNTLRKVLEDKTNRENVTEGLVASLTEGDRNEHYKAIKGLFLKAKNENWLKNVGTVSAVGGNYDYKGVLKKIKDTVKGMGFVNADFNTGNIERRTPTDDIVILMPYKLVTELDIEELATLFNLEKAEIKEKIIEIDTTDNIIYIVDKNAILVYTRLYMMTDIFNPKGLFMNYYLSTDRLYAISQLFDGAFFEAQNA